jgi:hypothetical protein
MPLATGANDPITGWVAFPDAPAGLRFSSQPALSEKGLRALTAAQRSRSCGIPPLIDACPALSLRGKPGPSEFISN